MSNGVFQCGACGSVADAKNPACECTKWSDKLLCGLPADDEQVAEVRRNFLEFVQKVGGPGGHSLTKQPLSADAMLQWFEYEHLPPHLQAVSAPFCTLAHRVVRDLPGNPERTVALRKLLEAKDCGVRALLYKYELTAVVTSPVEGQKP